MLTQVIMVIMNANNMNFKEDDGMRLYHAEEVPCHVREPFIYTGYRGRCGTALRCLRTTLFVRSNETLNFWTHVVPAVYFAWTAVSWWFSETSLSGSSWLALTIYLSTVCIVPVTSAIAHMFSCASDKAWHICFFADYAALSVYAIGASVAYRFFAFPPVLHGGWYAALYIPLSGFIAAASLAGSCWSRFLPDGTRRKAIRFFSLALPYLFDIAPVVYGLVTDSEAFKSSRILHQRQFVAAFLAAVIYCLHLPERLFPGQFDFIGHSHQIFHVIASLGCRDQMMAFLQTAASGGTQAGDIIPIAGVVIIVAVVIAADVAILICFIGQLKWTVMPCESPSKSGQHYTSSLGRQSCNDVALQKYK